MSALAKAAYVCVLESASHSLLVRLLPDHYHHTAQGVIYSHTHLCSGTGHASESSRPCRMPPYICRVHNNPPKACWLAGLLSGRPATLIGAASFQAMKCHCRVISICTPRPSQLHVVVGFGLLWRAERLRSLCEKPPILLPELASVGRYLSILENNAWQNGCTWHTFLSVRAEEKIAACCRVLSTSSPTSFTGCRRGTLSGASQIFLRKPCISATDTSRPQREHPRSRV
jgi:hypothetical protein